jgi:hypothetical protein
MILKWSFSIIALIGIFYFSRNNIWFLKLWDWVSKVKQILVPFSYETFNSKSVERTKKKHLVSEWGINSNKINLPISEEPFKEGWFWFYGNRNHQKEYDKNSCFFHKPIFISYPRLKNSNSLKNNKYSTELFFLWPQKMGRGNKKASPFKECLYSNKKDWVSFKPLKGKWV